VSSIAPGAVGRVFISYRRSDAAYPASWLFDLLVDRYGQDRVFKDVDSIAPGENFAEVIATAVQSCTVLLAVIGRQWLTAAAEDGRRRLDDRGDFVRMEIELALRRNVRVIPVLVDEARLPRAGELPPGLGELSRRQAIELGPNRFRADSRRLLTALDDALAAPVPPPPPPDPAAHSARHDDVAQRQARIQADLNEAQKIYTEMSEDRYRWIGTMQRTWQDDEPEAARKLGLERFKVSPDQLFGGGHEAPGEEPQST
jgi:hypothetical protein